MIALPRQTRIELTDAETGRQIASRLLADGEMVSLSWTNSLFRLPVTEVFVAGGGTLTLTEITFADPGGREPPLVRPEDVDDLYHTGGPFRVEGLSRTVTRVVFRVGELGNPTIHVGDTSIQFAREVGFGGAVRLTARPAGVRERIVGQLRMLRKSFWPRPLKEVQMPGGKPGPIQGMGTHQNGHPTGGPLSAAC
jgi:hypothetical protein